LTFNDTQIEFNDTQFVILHAKISYAIYQRYQPMPYMAYKATRGLCSKNSQPLVVVAGLSCRISAGFAGKKSLAENLPEKNAASRKSAEKVRQPAEYKKKIRLGV